MHCSVSHRVMFWEIWFSEEILGSLHAVSSVPSSRAISLESDCKSVLWGWTFKVCKTSGNWRYSVKRPFGVQSVKMFVRIDRNTKWRLLHCDSAPAHISLLVAIFSQDGDYSHYSTALVTCSSTCRLFLFPQVAMQPERTKIWRHA
jgi:hypothetical protein